MGRPGPCMNRARASLAEKLPPQGPEARQDPWRSYSERFLRPHLCKVSGAFRMSGPEEWQQHRPRPMGTQHKLFDQVLGEPHLIK